MYRKGIISAFVIVVALAGCAPAIKNKDNQGHYIICFGDSITRGQGAELLDSYPEVLGQLITAKTVINSGVSGDTTATALKRLQKDVLKKKPFLVIIELGGNDFLQQVPREETLKNLETMIVAIQAGGAAVALCDLGSGRLMPNYTADYKRLARKTQALLIPGILEDIINNPQLCPDHIHPNRAGYRLIAQRVHKRLSEYFDL
jgi:acyl-CoA thioesterase-1